MKEKGTGNIVKIKTKLYGVFMAIITVVLIGFMLHYEKRQDEELTDKSKISEKLVKEVFEMNILIYESLLHRKAINKRIYTQCQLQNNSISGLLTRLKSNDPKEQALLADLSDDLKGINVLFREVNKIIDDRVRLGGTGGLYTSETEENLVS